MATNVLGELIACPACMHDISIVVTDTVINCSSCNSAFRKEGVKWNFIPENVDFTSSIWKNWQKIQRNGLVSYEADPEKNLSVGERNDCKMFAKFCNFHGIVLDVGCGPQSCPAYIDLLADAEFVGVDPLVGNNPADFLKLKALGEFLPFRAAAFDQVLFSTTLDHFAEPLLALRSAARVCKPTGEIVVWVGEKKPEAPKPEKSPDWYRHLKKPKLAEDVFHIKRLGEKDISQLTEQVGLEIVETERHRVDEYRENFFFRLRRSQG